MERQLAGRYLLIRELGSGGMGSVFEAIDTQTGRTVAAKVMIASGALELQSLLRFQQEGAVLATLQHPNIVEVYSTFLEENTCAIIMELLEGGALSQLLRNERISLTRVRGIADQVLGALEYAHSRGIVHRDIKPDNIMIVADDVVKVADFGIARVLTSGGTFNTVTGTTMGTPLYMSPEQIEGQKVDGRSDLYSLGAVLYQMVTGRPPFEGDDPVTVAFKHVHRAPQPPSDINPDIPADWETIILKALAKNPAERFQTASSMLNAFSTLGQDDVIELPSMGEPTDNALDRSQHTEPAAAGTASTAPAATLAVAESDAKPEVVHQRAGIKRPERSAASGASPGSFNVSWPVAAIAIVLGAVVVVIFVIVANRSSSPTAATRTPTRTQPSGAPTRTASTAAGVPSRVPLSNAGERGRFLGGFGSSGSGPLEFSSPAAIATDNQGNVYVADRNNSRVLKFSGTGKRIADLPLATSISPDGIAVDNSGNIYLSDTRSSRIVKLSSSGRLIGFFGRSGTGPGQFQNPNGLGIDRAGNIVVADSGNNRVQVLSSSGKVLAVWSNGNAPTTHLRYPVDAAVDVDGNIYVSDQGNSRIQMLRPNGRPVVAWSVPATGSSQYSTVSAIAVDANGYVYAADFNGGTVDELSPLGKVVRRLGSHGTHLGQLSQPIGLALDAQGNLYVLDEKNSRVSKFALS